MATTDEWAWWAAQRNMRFYPVWETMRSTFRGGGLYRGGARPVTRGWSGSYGGLPVLGFVAEAGNDPAGGLTVVAVRMPGVTFPALALQEADFVDDAPGIPIETEFDLRWKVSAAHPGFARDVVSEAMRRELSSIRPDFTQIWFERDAILIASRGEVSPTAAERHLHLLRRLVDTIPSRVLDALRPRPFVPTLPAYHQVRPQTPAVPMVASPRMGNAWAVWAARRGWLHYPNGREVAERFNKGPVPGGRYSDAFVGKFGEMPCFGWRTISGSGPDLKMRHAVCLRRVGLTVEPVRLTHEDALLTELIGAGDIEVGDPDFDARWRVASSSPESARSVLTPGVWRRMAQPTVPRFTQMWFERDVAAVITDGPIGPDAVDEYLRFLHDVLMLVGRQ